MWQKGGSTVGHLCQIQKCIKVSRVGGRSRREEVAWTGVKVRALLTEQDTEAGKKA